MNYVTGMDLDVTEESIEGILKHINSVKQAWKIRKSIDGFSKERWIPLEYALNVWKRKSNCWVFENKYFYWCWRSPAPEPNKVLVITNAFGNGFEVAIENQRLCSEKEGYNYMSYSFPPPSGTANNWSKIVAIKEALNSAIDGKLEQVIWLDADIVFSRQIPFGSIFPSVSDICCGWYYPTGFSKAKEHTDGIANGCMFSLAATEQNLAHINKIESECSGDRYCQSYPFEEVALKHIYNKCRTAFRFEHLPTTPHSMWRVRENYTGIHHCVSGMGHARQQAIQDTHEVFLCDS